MSEDLRQLITAELTRRNLSHSQLATKAGVSKSLVSRTLRGDMPASADFCIKIAIALDVAPEYILRLAGILPAGEPNPTTPGPVTQEITRLAETLPPETRQELLKYARYLATGERYPLLAGKTLTGDCSASGGKW
jgi:transcriptional regulator with XRE-family HTH domain